MHCSALLQSNRQALTLRLVQAQHERKPRTQFNFNPITLQDVNPALERLHKFTKNRTLMNKWRCAALKPSTSRLSAGPLMAGPAAGGACCGTVPGFAADRCRFCFFLPSSCSCAASRL